MNIDTTINRARKHASLCFQLVDRMWNGEPLTATEIDEAYIHARSASTYLLSLREKSRQMPEPLTTRDKAPGWEELNQ
jgi:hypothetical protein